MDLANAQSSFQILEADKSRLESLYHLACTEHEQECSEARGREAAAAQAYDSLGVSLETAHTKISSLEAQLNARAHQIEELSRSLFTRSGYF